MIRINNPCGQVQHNVVNNKKGSNTTYGILAQYIATKLQYLVYSEQYLRRVGKRFCSEIKSQHPKNGKCQDNITATPSF